MTKVVFRKWKNGDIIALFPDDVNPHNGTVTSYMHIGQHSAADYTHVIMATQPANETEFQSLRQELQSIGYNNLRIAQRYRRLVK